MDTGDTGNEWAAVGGPLERDKPQVYVRVWLGATAVEHYRADATVAEQYRMHMLAHLPKLRCTIDPLPSINPPIREIQTWRLNLAAP